MKANSRRNSQTKRVWRVAIVIMVAVGLFYVAPSVLRVAGELALQPVLVVNNWIRSSEQAIPVYFRSRAALLDAQAKLEQQIIVLNTQPDYVAYLEAENRLLRNSFTASTSPHILAGVVAQPPRTPHDTLVLDVGSRAGIQLDATVYLHESIVIGTIISTTPTQSVVRLLSTPAVATTVYIFGPDIYTTATGYGGGVVRIGVPQGIQLREGDVVAAPALGGGTLGRLFAVESVPTQPEQYGYVRLPQSLNAIHTVTVSREAVVPQTFEAARATIDAARDALLTVPVPAGVLVDLSTSTATTSTSTSAIEITDTEQ